MQESRTRRFHSLQHGPDGVRIDAAHLQGRRGIQCVLEFLDWAKAIGATVDASCGCHITVGVESIVGTNDPQAMSEFARNLAHITRWHAVSLYG